MTSHHLTRRAFLAGASAAPFLGRFHQLAAAERKRFKIRDLRTMTLQGPSRTYVLVKVMADDGLYGMAEAYGTPGIGVKEQILSMKPGLVGKDPLEIDVIYTLLDEHAKDLSGTRTDGSAHNLMRAASGIEMALWDLAGKALGVPTSTLLGGRFRQRVRVYDHAAPAQYAGQGVVPRVGAESEGRSGRLHGAQVRLPAHQSQTRTWRATPPTACSPPGN